jgi:hypothetical protein
MQGHTIFNFIKTHGRKIRLKTLKEVIRFTFHISRLNIQRVQSIFENRHKRAVLVTMIEEAGVTVAFIIIFVPNTRRTSCLITSVIFIFIISVL